MKLDLHRMHGGPFAGEDLDRAQVPQSAFSSGVWRVEYERARRVWRGSYVRDQHSAGGRDWDWRDD